MEGNLLSPSSLGLTKANSVGTPGVKDPDPDYALIKTDESEGVPTLDGDAMLSKVILPPQSDDVESFIQDPIKIPDIVNGLNTGIPICAGSDNQLDQTQWFEIMLEDSQPK